jgi:hypothetical protein
MIEADKLKALTSSSRWVPMCLDNEPDRLASELDDIRVAKPESKG